MTAPPYTPQTGNTPNQNMPSQFGRDMSAGFMQAAFGILGQTLATDAGNPKLAEPFQQIGATIAGALHDRWYKQEYENFETQQLNPYKQAATSVQRNLQMQMNSLDRGEMLQPDGSITKIDPKSEGFIRTKDTVIRQSLTSFQQITDQFLVQAGKYANNPYINKIAQDLIQSQSSMVANATGPTPAQESEAQLADIGQTRAQSRYMDRMPAASGSGSEKLDQRGDPMALLQQQGPENFMKYLVGTPKGREWTAPYQTMVASKEEANILKEFPDLEGDEHAIKRELEKRESVIQERAAGLYMMTTFPEVVGMMKEAGFGDQFFVDDPVQEGEKYIKGDLPKKDLDLRVNEIQQHAMEQFDQYIRSGRAKSVDDAINFVISKWLPKFLNSISERNAGTIIAKAKIKSRLIEFFSDPENWSASPMAAEKFGTPKPGLWERTKRAAESNIKIPASERSVRPMDR